MANSYFYSNTAVQTTLSGSISAGATSITVAATTGFPGSYPYVLAVDYGASTEELVKVTAAAGTTLTVDRGFSGTSAQSHSLGATVRHVYHAGDATDFRTHEAATSGVHGVTGDLVGATMTQTLTNKTLTSPTINNATYANGGSFAGTFTGSPTFSGALTLSGAAVLSGGPSISAGGALAGTFTGSPTFSGAPTFSGIPVFSNEISHTNLYRGSRAATTDSQWETRVSGDANARWFVRADGHVAWGAGSATWDTNLYRSAANTLKTDDTLQVGGDLAVTGNLTAANHPKFATGSTTFNFSSTSTVDVSVSFPASRFSGTPKVTALLTSLPSGSSALIIRASSVTSSGMTLRCNDTGGVSRTLSITADWIAVEE
ncbi:H-type lectin domain-containing protein [Streptomyces coeruleoprunus]|uniref:H-type lectin domain-containing protein n=1 Tax=Streptomyces coeruleoprunus TaxID=285563 RepID=A0ABV9XII3_9ACTN